MKKMIYAVGAEANDSRLVRIMLQDVLPYIRTGNAIIDGEFLRNCVAIIVFDKKAELSSVEMVSAKVNEIPICDLTETEMWVRLVK